MTKYILQSGGIKNQPKLKRMFHRETVDGLGGHPKILMCNFAQGREYWEVKFDRYCNSIREDVDCQPEFQLAMPDEFGSQVAWADVVYFHGGDTDLLVYWMKQFDLNKLFKNKVIATNSASSQMLSSIYYTCDWRTVRDDGFGILPIKFGAHFYSEFGDDDPRGPIDWSAAVKELENFGDTSLPVFDLREGEYAVFEDIKHVKTVRLGDVA